MAEAGLFRAKRFSARKTLPFPVKQNVVPRGCQERPAKR
ncbi:hypothetical protein HMPREF7215_1101 [Pyramidobacter piscolens W5455]|uniref:Uncharacterized protein n=1 Tax=Pyramidobacter piscolens W5455 TaxID=352165 RepID=A0ABM9ZT20_9BACT|nr:hypothetical protein HMPREF7215_1101 [Pyramidobacter piscolens W5455]